MSGAVYLAFATGPRAATPAYLDRIAELNPDAVLLVVAREKPSRGEWIAVHERDSAGEIVASCRRATGDREVRGVAVHATRGGGEWRMRLAAYRLAGRELAIFNDGLDHFPLSNTSVLWQHLKWRWSGRPRGVLWWKMLAGLAMLSARIRKPRLRQAAPAPASAALEPGISLVIPTRDGRELLSQMLPAVVVDLQGHASEIIVVDNGSSDQTSVFLREHYPDIRIESSAQPLSFAAAVNRGIRAARYSHVVLLNNDMLIEPGFFAALLAAFDNRPELFSSTAQIFFPEGHRREETGLCFWRVDPGDDFPVYCDEPKLNEQGVMEDGTLVLYGSGGCSMYDTAKLRELGGFDEVYQPAYVEDLDIGYRAWHRGWPTVFCASARVEHRHRATTSRYFTTDYLDFLVERNYLRFLARATGDLFPELWRQAIGRLTRRAASGDKAARRALRSAWREPWGRLAQPAAGHERARKSALTR